MNRRRLDGRAALITGGASGLGRAIALSLAAEGAKVAIVDRDLHGAAGILDAVARCGSHAVVLEADVTASAEIQEAVDNTVRQFGGINILCNSAGVLVEGPVSETSEEDWDRCFAVNTKGTFLMSQLALPHLSQNTESSIVNVASVAAVVGMPGFSAYSAAKGAVVALTRTMAVELASRCVRVNVICPGTFRTRMTESLLRDRGVSDWESGATTMAVKYPIGRLGTAEEVARVAVFLASDDASFMTGAVVTADGGYTAQ